MRFKLMTQKPLKWYIIFKYMSNLAVFYPVCVFQPETQADAGILWLQMTLFLCLRTKTKKILYALIHQKTKENYILQSDEPEDIRIDGENQVITSPVSYTQFFHLNGIH